MEISLFAKILLGILVLNLLVWPLVSKWVENHLELFLLMVGAAAVTVTGGWSKDFIYQTFSRGLTFLSSLAFLSVAIEGHHMVLILQVRELKLILILAVHTRLYG